VKFDYLWPVADLLYDEEKNELLNIFHEVIQSGNFSTTGSSEPGHYTDHIDDPVLKKEASDFYSQNEYKLGDRPDSDLVVKVSASDYWEPKKRKLAWDLMWRYCEGDPACLTAGITFIRANEKVPVHIDTAMYRNCVLTIPLQGHIAPINFYESVNSDQPKFSYCYTTPHLLDTQQPHNVGVSTEDRINFQLYFTEPYDKIKSKLSGIGL
jgi:hypothetical protein|tara:strand:+ start:2402 stop:3031 length:630 start_codon:yes stop_codon:yes gene_type:complete